MQYAGNPRDVTTESENRGLAVRGDVDDHYPNNASPHDVRTTDKTPSPCLPPLGVVLLPGDAAGVDVPTPLVDEVPEREEGEFLERLAHQEVQIHLWNINVIHLSEITNHIIIVQIQMTHVTVYVDFENSRTTL